MAVKKNDEVITKVTNKAVVVDRRSKEVLEKQLQANYFSDMKDFKGFNNEFIHKFKVIRGKTIAGVYECIHRESGYRYAGSSRQIMKRLEDHISSLKRGTHDNHKIQELYNISPHFYFKIYIVEVLRCDSKGNVLLDKYSNEYIKSIEEECWEIEQMLVDSYRANGIELNIAKDVRYSFADQVKPIIVYGQEFDSVKKAAASTKINRNRLSSMANDPNEKDVVWKQA